MDGPANPCGLVAKSFFNDTYRLCNSTDDTTVCSSNSPTRIYMNDTKIAWESDIEHKFKNSGPKDTKDWKLWQWMNLEDEHFIVWMRTAGLPNFRKLWARVEGDLLAGTYIMTIQNNYDVSQFEGKKSFVLSTTNALGGKNYFLAICYIVVGGLCFVFAIIFLVAYLRKKRAQGSGEQQAA